MLKFIRKIKAGILWSKAIGEFHAGRADSALDILNRKGKLFPLRSFELAYIAQVYIWKGDSQSARPYIMAALERTNGQANENARYVNIYARVIKALMDNEGPVEPLINAAKTIKCRQVLRRWLPLSKEDTEI